MNAEVKLAGISRKPQNAGGTNNLEEDEQGISLNERIGINEEEDELIKKIAKIEVVTWRSKLKYNVKAIKTAAVLGVVLGAGYLAQTEEAENVWKWIKLQTAEMIASGPTLSTDPIGVFSRSFIGYTKSIDNINPEHLIPLSFNSITRFKLDAIRFKAEFGVDGDTKGFSGCDLVVEGSLDAADGGISPDSYYIVKQCQGASSEFVEGYRLVAFPPEKNVLLSPANYALYKIDGMVGDNA